MITKKQREVLEFVKYYSKKEGLLAQMLCCDVCYHYKTGTFKTNGVFTICLECLKELNVSDEIMVDGQAR